MLQNSLQVAFGLRLTPKSRQIDEKTSCSSLSFLEVFAYMHSLYRPCDFLASISETPQKCPIPAQNAFLGSNSSPNALSKDRETFSLAWSRGSRALKLRNSEHIRADGRTNAPICFKRQQNDTNCYELLRNAANR